jgi:hypothetical protein
MLIDSDLVLSNECEIVLKFFGNFSEHLSYVRVARTLYVLA